MEFFNKKEEVIDLQLTQYGKYLLSQGSLKPVYYAFYDEGIIYDSNYAGFTEIQNNAKDRIQNDSPNLKAFHNFHSIQDDLARAVEVKYSGNEKLAQLMIQQTPEKMQTLTKPLANSDLATNNAPAWNISLLNGKILTGSTTSTLTLSSSATILNIPQIEVEIKYSARVKDSSTFTEDDVEQLQNSEAEGLPQSLVGELGTIKDPTNIIEYFDVRVFDDGTYISVDKDNLIFQIIEEHVPLNNDNFEIEFFALEDVKGNGKIKNTTSVQEAQQLKLLIEPDLVVNDILIDETQGNILPVSEIDNSFADYYFDIEADDEIDASIICELIKNGDKDKYKFARKDFECPDIQPNYKLVSPYPQKEQDAQCGDAYTNEDNE